MDEYRIIGNHLEQLEESYNIRILWAVENGSRAWGFESPDSDFDIRFVYHKRIDRYLRVTSPIDQIIRDIKDPVGHLDMVGFDIFKFTRLLVKTNPNMIEWCKSPMVYKGEVNPVMNAWISEKFNPIALYNAYRSIAYNSYAKYIVSEKQNTYKKHLYVVRGILNAHHVAIFNDIPPMKFFDLRMKMSRYIPTCIGDSITWIFKMKKEHKEREEVGNDKHMENLSRFYELIFATRPTVPSRKVLGYDSIDQEIKRILLSGSISP